jgi:DNA-binding GntR family transcriptional regulator
MTTPGWATVAEQLRMDINADETGPEGQLDTEAELCRRFATSRITVRRALAELRREGLVASTRGSGSRAVNTKSPMTVVVGPSLGALDQESVVRSNIHWRTSRPNSDLAATIRRAAFSVSLTESWLRLSYDQCINGKLFDSATVWFAPAMIPFVDRGAFANGPTAALIARAGASLGRSIQTVTTRCRDPRSDDALPLEERVDLVLERVMLTVDEQVAFVSIHRHPASSVCIRVDLPTTNESGRFLVAQPG